jgi:hypothetical protein
MRRARGWHNSNQSNFTKEILLFPLWQAIALDGLEAAAIPSQQQPLIPVSNSILLWQLFHDTISRYRILATLHRSDGFRFINFASMYSILPKTKPRAFFEGSSRMFYQSAFLLLIT